MAEVKRAEDGLRVQLEAHEAGILRELAREMRMLLEADLPPNDDVLERLFPRAHDDEQDEAAYRELVGNELRDVKLEALRIVEEQLRGDGPFDRTIPDGEIHEWLRLINDMRLAIGVRLEVDEEKMSKEFDPRDPEGPALSVLHWLGWMQESILKEMT